MHIYIQTVDMQPMQSTVYTYIYIVSNLSSIANFKMKLLKYWTGTKFFQKAMNENN